MKKIFLFFFFSFISNASSLEISCYFEEVYKDSSIQQGFILINNENMRYQYLDNNLFTIFKKNDEFYLLDNKNHKKFQKVSETNNILPLLAEIAKNYPNVDNIYQIEDMNISIEKSKENLFIKRISVQSKKLNFSIFFSGCKNIAIDKKYFNYFPYFPFR